MEPFWTGGRQAYEAAVRQEYAAKITALEDARRQAGPEEHGRIAEELRRLKDELQTMLGRVDESLF